ncbi:MAG TPA: DnaA N-terminal domain-containing protein [Herpetosiphonaceae bacterium]
MYAYLRDTYEQQRAMFPLLVKPEGPTKQQMQRKLGKRSAWAIQGPEYLLRVTGLADVVVDYGQSSDPAHPQRTRVAYYTIGRLDQPVLNWAMLSHVLDALVIGLDSSSGHADDQKAQSAIQALKQGGFLQEGEPGDLFWELGAWPHLLPALINDPRWEAIYSSLHTAGAIRPYREQARRWVEYALQKAARLAHENQAMADMLQAAQRRGPHGAHPTRPAVDTSRVSVPYQIPATQAHQVTSIACVADESLDCREAVEVTSIASATLLRGSHSNTINPLSDHSDSESLARDQLTLTSLSVNKRDSRDSFSGATSPGDSTLNIQPHIRQEELHTTKLDTVFWATVNQILNGTLGRYPHSAGEKKAAERQFSQRNIPSGVALAALRLVMTLPVELRPRTFGEALKLDTFQRAVQQGLLLLPARPHVAPTWESFLWTYRTVGLTDRLRDVGHADYMVLRSLYERNPDECWEVLSRCQHAQSPAKLTPQYLRRAIANNQRAAAEQILSPGSSQELRHPVVVDPRYALLTAEGLAGVALSDDITEEYIRAWIMEADHRASGIKTRPGWLRWGILSGYWPHEHPQLPPRPGQPVSIPPAHDLAQIPDAQPESEWARLWGDVLMRVRDAVSPSDYATWIQSTHLVDMSDEVLVIAVPHVLARDGLLSTPQLLQTLTACAAAVIPTCTDITIVIDSGVPLC